MAEETTEQTNSTNKPKFIDVAVLTTIVPGLLYCSSYLYKYSLFSIYSVPTIFLKVEFSDVLVPAGILCFAMATGSLLYLAIKARGITKKTKNQRSILYLGFPVITLISVTFILLLINFPYLPYEFAAIISLFTNSVILYLIDLSVAYSKNKSGNQPIPEEWKEKSRELYNARYFQYSIFITLIIVIFSFALPDVRKTRDKHHTMFEREKHKFLVIDRNDDFLILKELNLKDTSLFEKIFIKKLSESDYNSFFESSLKLKIPKKPLTDGRQGLQLINQ